MNPVRVLASGRTYRRIVHLLLGAVVLLPYLALGWLLAQAARAGTAVVAVVLLGALALGIGVAIALVPGVRALEVAAARALLGVADLPDPAPDAEAAWPGRRRAAVWLLVNMVVGGLVGLAILVAVPVAVGLVVAPWQSQPPVPTGAAGWWAPPAGLALLPLLVLVLAAVGAWAARAAPRFLGPAPAERLAGELAAARARADRLADRARLARELHDSVGHALTVTTLQAGAAGALLDTDPAFVRRALAAIEETGRTALDELDHVLGLLREETGAERETAPRDLRALDALVEGARSAGVAVDLHRDGVLDGVAPVVSREVYRLVQEALTNALRHAGPVPVTIRLATRGDDLDLTVDNPLPPGRRSRRRGGGSGLSGMAERASRLGGELTAGPDGEVWRLARAAAGRDGMTGLLIVDDEELVRTGLRAVLDAQPDMTVLGEGSDGAEVPGLVARLRPDVVLMDVRMPAVDGITATRDLLRRPDPPRVLVLTTFGNDGHVYDALRAGAAGFLLKRTRPADIVQAVRTVSTGESLLFPAAVRELVAGFAPSGGDRLAAARLTEREAEVLRLMARGLSNGEIAAELVLGVETIKTHVGNVLAKLSARDRTQAVVRAYESGFIDPRSPVR